MTSPKRTRLGRMLLLLPLAILLQSCAKTTVSGGIEAPAELQRAPFCAVAEPISWSSKDTEVTVLEIKQFNAMGVALCGWKAE